MDFAAIGKVILGVVVVALIAGAIGAFAAVVVGGVAVQSELFSRPTGISGDLSWGPVDIARDYMFRVFARDDMAVSLSFGLFQTVVAGLFAFLGIVLIYKVAARVLGF